MINPTFLSLGGLATNKDTKFEDDREVLGSDFDDFLKLLTTQLKNQDPLDPTDSKEFTSQLIGFSQVEQQINTNKQLKQITGLNEAALVNSAVSFINKVIRYEGDFFHYKGEGGIESSYFLADDTYKTKITILNEKDEVVFSMDGELKKGEHEFIWDGKDNFGEDVPPGNYQLKVGAQNEAGRAVQTSSLVPGTVDGVEIIDGNVFLIMNDLLVSVDSVLSVRDQTASYTPKKPDTGSGADKDGDTGKKTDKGKDTDNDQKTDT